MFSMTIFFNDFHLPWFCSTRCYDTRGGYSAPLPTLPIKNLHNFRLYRKEKHLTLMMMTHPVPAPRTPKGREVARSTLEAASVAENKHDLSRLERILMASRNEDLNLTALINAVERDIWYMEQLESNPSVLRRKDSPQELPFPITDELLRLPGYKPRLRNSKSPSPEIHRMEPPLLPPKQRQRRHSDTVTSLTDASFLMQHQNSCSRSLTRKNSLQANAVLER